MTNKKQKVAHYLEAGQEPHEIEIELSLHPKSMAPPIHILKHRAVILIENQMLQA